MTEPDATLDALRREIDTLDDAMHDLLMRRADLAERVRAAKGGGALFRPGREMAILRRLLRRHAGPLPQLVLARIWREIVSGLLSLQGRFEVAVHAPAAGQGLLDLARDHFGALVVLTPTASPSGVLTAVTDGKAQLGLLPAPEESPDDPWWRGIGLGRVALTIVARLPVMEGGGPTGLLVGKQDFEPTGEDRGYVLVETDRDFSRARLKAAFDAVDLAVLSFQAAANAAGRSGETLGQVLVETGAWCGADDPRLAALRQRLGEGAMAVRVLGGYAAPIPAAKKKRSAAT